MSGSRSEVDARLDRDALARARDLVATALAGSDPIVALTGAGISAESGIPTFRGADGYWTIGSRNYQPEELATMRAFLEMPRELWAWYLCRRGDCRRAEPNDGHRALARLDATLGERMRLVTQNIDGLHLRAGHDPSRLYEIHGNLGFMRPLDERGEAVRIEPIPEAIGLDWTKERALDEATERLLRIDGAPARPHVLWFDECYDEARFRAASAVEAAEEAALLIVVGTTGATALPMHIGMTCAERGIPMIVVDPEPNVFAELATLEGDGVFVQAPAGMALPAILFG